MRGFTLIELVVALAIIGLLGGIGALAFHRSRLSGGEEAVRRMAAAQRTAVKDGHSVSLIFGRDTVLFLPDGRALGRLVNPLSGAAHAAKR